MTVVERPNTPVCGTGFRGFKSRQSPLYRSLVESVRLGRWLRRVKVKIDENVCSLRHWPQLPLETIVYQLGKMNQTIDY